MEEEKLISNKELELAKKYVEYTNTNIFLTGKAGTGKTTFLKTLKETTSKRMVIVAPTGVAAINAGGVTIHSFFQVSFGPFVEGNERDKDNKFKISKVKKEVIRSMDLLVIDEISMVRADLLDAIDYRLRQFRKDKKFLPFGGVQLLMIGDLQQLPPVCKDEEWGLLQLRYNSPYFFSSLALQKSDFITINLQQVFRQKDERFINILNKIRNNQIDENLIEALNDRNNVDYDPNADDAYVILCTHNYQANRINENKLRQIDNESYKFTAFVDGEFPESSYPNEFELELKLEAQVMFVKNDIGAPEQRKYYNGKIGKIVEISDDRILVRSKGDTEDIVVKKYVWNNYHYRINNETNEIEEDVLGTFEQYPLKLAWAITIHKSQGLTFEKVIIDSNKSFAAGQVYVALSRCKSLEGIILTSPFEPQSIIKDPLIEEFDSYQEENKPTKERLDSDKLIFTQENLLELYSFKELKWRIDELKTLNNTSYHATYGQTSNLINEKIKTFETGVFEVSLKFENQIKNLCLKELDTYAIERLIKAKEYFSQKLDIVKQIIRLLDALEFDNRQVEEQKEKNNLDIAYETFFKLTLFECIKSEFSIVEYRSHRSKTLIKEPKDFVKEYFKKHKPKQEQPKNDKETSQSQEKELPTEIENEELFEVLNQWRRAKAEEIEKPAFVIMHQRTLIEIVNSQPKTEKELLAIKGFGKSKMKEYGAEILDIIESYTLEDNK
ncbi:MAG: helicase [Bacteroidetes bacterium]|nr:helicase [Bacteroidota bacterium]